MTTKQQYNYEYLQRFCDAMIDRAGYYYDTGPRFRQKAVLFALQKLMKNDLSFGQIFPHGKAKHTQEAVTIRKLLC